MEGCPQWYQPQRDQPQGPVIITRGQLQRERLLSGLRKRVGVFCAQNTRDGQTEGKPPQDKGSQRKIIHDRSIGPISTIAHFHQHKCSYLFDNTVFVFDNSSDWLPCTISSPSHSSPNIISYNPMVLKQNSF